MFLGLFKKLFIGGILLCLSICANANDDVDITTLHIPVKKSFQLLDLWTGKTKKVRPNKNLKIRIIGERKGAYIVHIIDKGVEKPRKYLVAKKWARKALNIMAAVYAARLNEVVAEVGKPVGTEECAQTDLTSESGELRPRLRPVTKPEPIFAEDAIDPELPKTVTSKGAWKPGCEVLEKGKELSEGDRSKLHKCIRAIQLSITEGTRKKNGRLKRTSVFKNIFKRLKPEEQDFALKIFTVQGEVGSLANGGNYQEMMGVIKVIDNRVRNSNTDRQNRNGNRPFNAAHIALDEWQFSMYNETKSKKVPSWENIMDPGNSANFSNAIKSFVKYQKATIEPDPEMNHVYHYHANYILPSSKAWGKSFRRNHKAWEVDVKVDGRPLRAAPAGYDEGKYRDRKKIAKRRELIRHRFYISIDRGGRVTNKDDFFSRVSIPWD